MLAHGKFIFTFSAKYFIRTDLFFYYDIKKKNVSQENSIMKAMHSSLAIQISGPRHSDVTYRN